MLRQADLSEFRARPLDGVDRMIQQRGRQALYAAARHVIAAPMRRLPVEFRLHHYPGFCRDGIAHRSAELADGREILRGLRRVPAMTQHETQLSMARLIAL